MYKYLRHIFYVSSLSIYTICISIYSFCTSTPSSQLLLALLVWTMWRRREATNQNGGLTSRDSKTTISDMDPQLGQGSRQWLVNICTLLQKSYKNSDKYSPVVLGESNLYLIKKFYQVFSSVNIIEMSMVFFNSVDMETCEYIGNISIRFLNPTAPVFCESLMMIKSMSIRSCKSFRYDRGV